MAPDAATLVREEPPVVSPPPAPPAPRSSQGPAAPAPEAAPAGAISRNWALVLGLGWPVAVAIATALEPAPANPEAAASPLASLLGLAFVLGLMAAVGSAAARRARAPMWSALFGVLALGLVVACPASGHHGFGTWWMAELALYGGMLGVSVAALKAARR